MQFQRCFLGLPLACLLVATLAGQLCELANVAINNRTVEDWIVTDLKQAHKYKPMFINNHSVVPHDEVSNWPVRTYYWQAPEPYYQWKIYTYGGDLQFLVNHVVTRGDTSGKYLDEPDLVLEGGPREHYMKLGYRLTKDKDMIEGYDKNQTITMPLTEPGWFHLEERESEDQTRHLVLGDMPASRADFSLVLAGLNRSLIRAKYHGDQVEGGLYDVNMHLLNNKSRTHECDNDCSGPLLDDLDDIGLLMDEIRRLAPGLKDGPWRRLAYLSNRANKLGEALGQYLRLIGLGKELMDKQGLNSDFETLADLLDIRASNLDSRAPAIAMEAYQVRLLAEKTLDELLRLLWARIREAVKTLNEHGFSSNGASPSKIERIVQESEMILRELRNRNFKLPLDDAERELRRAKTLLDKIRTLLIDPEKSNELLKRLEQLQKVLLDFSRIVQDLVLKPANKANELVAEGKKKYAAILALLKEADERGRDSQAALDEAKRLLEITKKCLAEEAAYLDVLPRQLIDLNNSIHEIEVKRSILTSVNPDYQKRYVDKCQEHKDQLWKKAGELDGLFNATRDVAEFALRAANVYKNIILAIEGAEKAAKRAFDAAEKAYKVAFPDFDESLAERARKSKKLSQELLEKAQKLRDQDVQRLSLELAKQRNIIDELLDTLKSLAGQLDAINAALKALPDFFEQLQELDAFLKRLLERIADIHKRLQLLSDLIYNSLFPQFERLSAGSQSSLGNLSQVIDLARKDLLAAIKYASNSKASLEKLLRLEAKLDLDLDLLRRKIQLGHQEASSVHVSVSPGADSGVCTRSYFVPALLSAQEGGLSIAGFKLQQISLTWSLHSDEPESLLLFMGGKQPANDEFLAIEMYERRIRLIYNLNSYSPSGVQVLTHPRAIELNDKGMLSDDAWYIITVSVSRDDQQIQLSVKPSSKSEERDSQIVGQRLTLNSGGSSKLIVSPYGEADINLLVGGLPQADEFAPSERIRSSRLTGCLYDLSLNQQQVGLWNFKTNTGCEGCVEGPVEARDMATYSFTGAASYATVSQSRNYDRTRYMVSMSAKTTDDEALLFLAISQTSNQYLAVYLSKGRVSLLIGKFAPSNTNYLGLFSSSLFDHALAAHLRNLNNSTAPSHHTEPIEHVISTSREYNTGQWIKITAEKDQTKLVLAVEDEFKESIVDDKLMSLDVDQSFFGGTWPLIRPRLYANTSLLFSSFTGCLKDIQIETSPVDLLRHQSSGVERGCLASQASRSRSSELANRVAYPLPAGRR